MKTTPTPAKTVKPRKAAGAAKNAVQGSTRKKELSVRHERFCEFIAAGESQTDAYLKAGYAVPKADARKHAAALMTKKDIKARIAALRAPETKAARYSKEEKLAFLASIMRTPVGEIGPDSPLCSEFTEDLVAGGNRGTLRKGNKPSGNEVATDSVIRRKIKGLDKLRALELHSKLVGDFEPEKVTVDAGPNTLDAIRERAKSMASALALAIS